MDFLKRRRMQLIAIFLTILSATLTTTSVISSAVGMNLLGLARIALPLSLVFLLAADYPRFKTSAARIPFLGIGWALFLSSAYIWLVNMFL